MVSKLNGELQGWVRTILLGIAIGGAYADLRAQVKEVQKDVGFLALEVQRIAAVQAKNVPLFERSLWDMELLEKRLQNLEQKGKR